MRARFGLGVFGCVALALFGPWACYKAPDDDFSDYQTRIAAFPKQVVEAAAFEAAPPPTQAEEATFWGGCLCELAFQQTTKIFTLYATTKFVPSTGGTPGGTMELHAKTLGLVNSQPPSVCASANEVGADITGPTAPVDATGNYTYSLDRVTFPGSANPISGSDVVISGAKLEGKFAADRFCGRLTGHVEQPAAAARDLSAPQNICQFRVIKDGDPAPKLTLADYQAESCPVP
jgi:hypothetical protein